MNTELRVSVRLSKKELPLRKLVAAGLLGVTEALMQGQKKVSTGVFYECQFSPFLMKAN